jgi:BlaI family penicillinase repressor
LNRNVDKISDSEAEVMKVVWNSKEPVTFTQIRATLSQETGWESQTINTLLKRLVQKGILQQVKKDVYYYSPLINEDEYIQAKTQLFVKKIYAGNVKGLMSALINYEDISQKDMDDLRDFWKKGRKDHE